MKFCKHCEKELIRKAGQSAHNFFIQKFCDSSCSARFNNIAFPKRRKEYTNNCKQCGKVIQRRGKSAKFCDLQCFNEFQFENKTKIKIEKGECISPCAQKNYLSRTRGEKCEICGQLPVWNDKYLVLQVDHIDGNSDNNVPENLRLLCPNCHTQTDTFCSSHKKFTKRNRYLRKFKGYTGD